MGWRRERQDRAITCGGHIPTNWVARKRSGPLASDLRRWRARGDPLKLCSVPLATDIRRVVGSTAASRLLIFIFNLPLHADLPGAKRILNSIAITRSHWLINSGRPIGDAVYLYERPRNPVQFGDLQYVCCYRQIARREMDLASLISTT